MADVADVARGRVAVLGTGSVGGTLARRLAQVGHDVVVGARGADSASLAPYAAEGLRTGSFADAVAAGELVVNATNGQHSAEALRSTGDALDGKVVLDVANDLEPVEGGFPRPRATADDSLVARLAAEFPQARFVKSLNTMTAAVMADPSLVPGDHVVFLSGDDEDAKDDVRALLATMGWRDVQMLDLGGLASAAGTEMMMSVWMSVTLARGRDAPRFNWAVHAPDRP